ncbi:P-loop containing nucleoside triphosphate hydrolase protein [Rhizopogon vinicolor AM-OR11-026]|uniref:p-loop containing nucleoside triphosphate hydrolase protein n=1 Tax=Rhizopogon vinicolor AM-OR11-026 TaxID=1314800 RepID=A0A1B7NEV1_9AGAM|nr:P-loop containing nucleoside triphosphate hydrolase protein [Rhizopogon vinicolor AM-OR11-026]
MFQTKPRTRTTLERFASPLQNHAWSNIFKEGRGQREAQRISREIDKGILESKKLLTKKDKAIKVLIMGQPESGKLAVLRNLLFALHPTYFHDEALRWKTIIQLNLIDSVKTLLSIVEDELEISGPCSRSPAGSTSTSLLDHYQHTRMRLLPLLSIETNLMRQLHPEHYDPSITPEICEQAGSRWKSVLKKVTLVQPAPPGSPQCRPVTSDKWGKDDPTLVLAAFKDDIISLWEDESIQGVLRRRGVRLEDSPGFFLDDTARIAAVDYEPTEEDIVRARSRTSCIEEHRLVQNGSEWCIYNVADGRGIRPHWASYLDDVQAIVFLAPLVFNDTFEGDKQLNQLQHSMSLWRKVCGNPLLAHATIILLFNKMDILKERLDAGFRVETYFPSYGRAPNDVENVMKYFRNKFLNDHYQLSTRRRPLYYHQTSVIDTEVTKFVMRAVRDGILQRHLESSRVLRPEQDMIGKDSVS